MNQSEHLYQQTQRLQRQLRERDEEIARLREREADIAKMLQVADGGQYRADWEAPIRRLVGKRNSLRAFAQAILRDFPEGAPDCFGIQDLAVEHGLLEGVEATESCGDDCWCAEYGGFPMTCYRRTELLMGKEG